MKATPRWAAGALGLLLGIIMLLGLDRSGAFSPQPVHGPSWWDALLWLATGCLLGLAAAAYAARSSGRDASPLSRGDEAEQALRAVLAVSSQALLAIDSNGDVTMWSPAAARILGWGPEDAVTRPLPLVADGGTPGHPAFLQALRESRLGERTLIHAKRKDGTALALCVRAAPVIAAAQPNAGFVLAIEEGTTPETAGDHGGRPGVKPEVANAILDAALHATDLAALLEDVVARALGALQATAGGAWVDQVCVGRGLPARVVAAIATAARQGDREPFGATAVADWRAASADAPAGVREQVLLHGLRASVITLFTSKRGQAGGVIVAAPEPRSWTAGDCALVDAAGEILAESVGRLSLLEETQQRLRLLDRAQAIGRLLSHPAPVAEVAKIIGEGALEVAGADRAAVYLSQADGTLACAWSSNLSRTYVDQVLHYAKLLAGGHLMDGARPDLLELSGRGIDTSAPALYPDVQTLPPAVQVPRLTHTEGYRALGNWPLVYEGRAVGLLSCYYNAPHVWSAPERDILALFAPEAATALRNALAHEAQTQRAADLEALFELSRKLRAARNLDEIYPILVGHAIDLLHADNGTLALLEAGRPEFDCLIVHGLPGEWRGASFPISGSPFGRVAQTAVTYHTMNFGGEPLPVWMNVFRAVGPAVTVPVRSEEETIGVFCLGRKRRSDAKVFTAAEARLLEGIAEIGGTAIRRARLFKNLEGSYMQMVVSLVRTMDARDSYTSGHSERISSWAEAVARELGCAEAEVQDIRWSALLHDIGKIGVPDAILRKPGKLTEAEWVIMRKHPEIGEEILASTDRMRGVAALVRHHQEKWDGTGYPDGLKGDEIPLGARILSVCDAYSAITDDRPYKKARTHDEAVAELRRCAGGQFDPEVVEAFCRVVEPQRERERAGRAR